MAPKTVGILGLGYMGKIHAQNLKALGCKILSYEISQKNTDTNNITSVINGSDALVIATPSNNHSFELLCVGVKKHIFVEKPIGASRSDATEVRTTLSHTDKVIMTGSNMRYHPAVKQTREWLAENKIGRPKEAMFTIRQFKEKPRDCLMLNWGSHAVDLARYLLGDLTLVHSGMEETGDMAYLKLEGADDLYITVGLDYFTPEDGLNRFAIYGTRGWIQCDLLAYTASCHSQNDGDEVVCCAGKWNDMYVEEMEEFLDRVDGQEPDGIGATGEDGLACLDLLLEAKAKAVE